MELIYEDISSLTIGTKIFMLNHKSDIRRRCLPTEEIFLSVCDDRLPIVELLEWPIIGNVDKLRSLVLTIYYVFVHSRRVSKYDCTFH